jgi:hypothetical protein
MEFYEQITDVLGAPERRYFAEGFRHVSHSLRNVRVGVHDDGRFGIAGTGAVSYPADWSVKEEGGELRPHLSTLDAMVFATEVAECYLAHARLLDAGQRSRAWIRSMKISAANGPQLDLDAFDVTAVVASSAPMPLTLCGYVSVIEVKVGPLKVKLETEHEPGGRSVECGFYAHPGELLGGGARYYAEGYKAYRRDVENARLCTEDEWGDALAVVEPRTADHFEGLSTQYGHAMSYIDSLLITAQLTQALLYRIDNLDRSTTNTLWMRRIEVSLPTPYQPIATPFIAQVKVGRNRLLERDSMRWRTTDMTCRLLGMAGSFSITHALPTG